MENINLRNFKIGHYIVKRQIITSEKIISFKGGAGTITSNILDKKKSAKF